jgi:hypothetical protein
MILAAIALGNAAALLLGASLLRLVLFLAFEAGATAQSRSDFLDR